MRTNDTIIAIRAYTTASGPAPVPGGDYHDVEAGHWIDDHISTPMSKYPEYRETRSSFGLNVLGSLVVEVESASGEVGVGLSTGGLPGCWIVEHHLARFVQGAAATDVERIWDQIFNATLFYGRKGLVLNAISAVDLAIWDLLGRIRQEPVYNMIGGPVRDELTFYATSIRPDIAAELGFIGGKFPLRHHPTEGAEGFRANLAFAEQMRGKVGDDFWLMYDCWMSLDVDYTLRLIDALTPLRFKWIEEFLPPDDYWGYAEVQRRKPAGILTATGEHEYTRHGFRMLIDMQCCDILQPDVTWCGGLTELLKISALAEAHGKLIVPHGSSVYSYQFAVTRHHSPFSEFIMLAPQADRVTPMFAPLLIGEPVPVNGKLKLPDLPGFGVELNRDGLERPYRVG